MARKRKPKIPPNTWIVILHDEAPRIGCGLRHVQLVRLGPKWAHIRENTTQRGARLKAITWREIASCRGGKLS